MDKKGKLVVISAPSGAGKSSICNELIRRNANFRYSISATTRPPRPNEVDGEHYIFLSDREFEEKLNAGEFIEWETYTKYKYGTLKRTVEKSLNDGYSLIMAIDVNGGLNVKKHFPDTVLIFIKAPSMEVLRERLLKRGTETEEEIEKRLQIATIEYEKAKHYDYIVVNDDLEKAVKEIENIIC